MHKSLISLVSSGALMLAGSVLAQTPYPANPANPDINRTDRPAGGAPIVLPPVNSTGSINTTGGISTPLPPGTTGALGTGAMVAPGSNDTTMGITGAAVGSVVGLIEIVLAYELVARDRTAARVSDIGDD